MRRYRIPSALLSGRIFCIFLDQKLSDLNGGGLMAMQHHSPGLHTSVSESVSFGRRAPERRHMKPAIAAAVAAAALAARADARARAAL